MRLIYFLCILVLLAVRAPAQDNVSGIVASLKSGNRQWLLAGTQVSLGNHCKNGDILGFFKDQQAAYMHCDSGSWKKNQLRWTLTKVNHDWQIKIGDIRYILVLGKEEHSSMSN